METVFAVLRMAWGFFTDLTCPFLGISFASLFLGVMIVNFTIKLLRPLLGIGGSYTHGSMSRLSRDKRSADRESARRQRAIDNFNHRKLKV